MKGKRILILALQQS